MMDLAFLVIVAVGAAILTEWLGAEELLVKALRGAWAVIAFPFAMIAGLIKKAHPR